MPTLDEITKLKLNCLIQALTFETFWAYYDQSDGGLYSEECRQMARRFADAYFELIKADEKFANKEQLGLEGPYFTTKSTTIKIANAIKDFGLRTAKHPHAIVVSSKNPHTGLQMALFINGVKALIFSELEIEQPPVPIYSTGQYRYSRKALRWAAHLPRIAQFEEQYNGFIPEPDNLMENASKARSIIVIGDIRRSQDLMTYALKPSDFSTRMAEFILFRGLIPRRLRRSFCLPS